MDREEMRITIRVDPDTHRRIEQWWVADDCKSRNEFIKKAINFYVGYLTLHDDKLIIPHAISSALEGELRLFKKNIAAVLFKQAVEIDMTNSLLMDAYEVDEAYARKLRGESINNVKKFNGQLSLEQRVRQAIEPYEDDDPWLD